MGEALDALTADWGDDIQETAVFIQRLQPDAYFTAVQYCRMQELLAHRATLTAEERAELESLIDAELDATVARTEEFAPAFEAALVARRAAIIELRMDPEMITTRTTLTALRRQAEAATAS